MKLHGLNQLDKFLRKHRVAKKEIENWRALVERANWVTYEELVREFPHLRHVTANHVVFKLGNHWRIEVFINYPAQIVYVDRVGTHEEYNKWKYND